MSPSSHASDLAQLREALAQTNSEFIINLEERRKLCLQIQTLKEKSGISHYDPDQEKKVFTQANAELKKLSLKELLAFSLVMEDQAQAMAPGTYPAWSNRVHLKEFRGELFELINPLLLKIVKPEAFKRLTLESDYDFLNDF